MEQMHESERNRDDNMDQVQAIPDAPPAWLSIDELEALLFDAIVAETSANAKKEDGRFIEIDIYFAGPESGKIGDRRQSVLKLLAILRPLLSDLLGGPLAK
jgi:hypothetical protein